MRIRKMQLNDIETVYESGIKVKWFRSETSAFWDKKQIYEWVKSDDDVLLVAEDKGKIIGYVMSQFHVPTGKATIENIFVDEQYRKKEIGSKLIKECLKQLKGKESTYVCALVRPENKEAIKFLKSLGFNKVYDFTWMEKVL